MSSVKQFSTKEEQIHVAIRIRPFLPSEIEASSNLNSPIIVNKVDDQKISVGKEGNYYESYYDKIFFDDSTQKDVYNFLDISSKYIINGINCTVLAYGQTGSGKTYTMFGQEWTKQIEEDEEEMKPDEFGFLYNEISVDPSNESNGIIPRMIFKITTDKTFTNKFDMFCAFVQIYNEKIYDLLDDNIYNQKMGKLSLEQENKKDFRVYGKNDFSTANPMNQKPLAIREDKKIGIYIENLTQNKIDTYYDCINYLQQGESNRKKRQTSKNELSSRSHTLFMLTFTSKHADEQGQLISSRVNFCDLAGSEKFDKSYKYNKLHLQELTNINRSLYTLGNVINALANKKSYIPYRDSKLTQILQNSLGGNTKTSIIATISPNMDSYEETISTLKFADRVHSLFTKLEINKIDAKPDENNKQLFVSQLTKEVNTLRELLKRREKNGIIPNQHKTEILQQEVNRLKKENEKLKIQLKKAKDKYNRKVPYNYENSRLFRKSEEKYSQDYFNSNYKINTEERKSKMEITGESIIKNNKTNNIIKKKNQGINTLTKSIERNDVIKLLNDMQKENSNRLKEEIEKIKRETREKREKRNNLY